MTQWVKNLSASLCILTILMHLIPKGKFSKYVQFYAGLLFFLVAAKPVWEIFIGEGELERLLQLEFLKEEYYDLETSVSGMEDLKNEQILTAYQDEIQRQVEKILAAYEIPGVQAEVHFSEEDGYMLDEIELRGSNMEEYSSGLDAVCQEIAGVYMLERKNIHIQQE